MKRLTRLKRRTPLRSGTPLARLARLTQQRKRPRRSERVRDPAHVARIHDLPCWLSITDVTHRCRGPLEADHAGPRPLGRKCNDAESIPLCRQAHRERTDWTGVFKRWTQAQMRAWLADGIIWARATLAARVLLVPGGAR